MRNTRTSVMAAATALLLCTTTVSTAKAQSRDTTFPIAVKSTAATHTGDVFMGPMASTGLYGVTNFLFEKGARGRWHVHPEASQTLIILSGYAYYQEEGKPRRMLRKGDVVVTPKNVKHWNGATPWSHCECMTISEKVEGQQHAVQMEEVSDEEFGL